MNLTPAAKQLLSSTIRSLRDRLIQDITNEADRQYHLAIPIAQAGLDEEHEKRRLRLERWLDEQGRAAKVKAKDLPATRQRLLTHAVKEAGATLINRLVLVRHLEAMGLSKPPVVTGGWNSKGYQEFRDFAPGLLDDETEGYSTLLHMVFDELAVDLPGLFGNVGLTGLFPIPPATLREVISKLDDKDLESAWTDDTTLGWVYQYWNDPERESLDAKIADGGKIEPHEIASKTQMFTERYMVEWLLQNSLGLTWLCICKKNGWKADAERVLPLLDERRAAWRKKREAGEVALDELMPLTGPFSSSSSPLACPADRPHPPARPNVTAGNSGSSDRREPADRPHPPAPSPDGEGGPEGLENDWKYYVPQPIPDDAIAKAPDSIRTLKLLDPACGSGHFLVIAFDLLVRMYREEAKHRGEDWTDQEIAESILANNLHGLDIDPRAIQIAAAALYLKAKGLSSKMLLSRVNLVAPSLQIGNLPDDDPSLVQLRKDLMAEAGIPEEFTRKLVSGLAGVDHLGSLLKVDAAIDDALKSTELQIERGIPGQGDLFSGFAMQQVKLTMGEAKATVLDKLERFLERHSSSEDLGLRLDGEQIAAGVRFVRLAKEGTYDVVVGNPPYQSLGKTAISDYVGKNYPRGKADLYAAFLERGLDLTREGGLSALLTMRGWMFLVQFARLREKLLKAHELRLVGDVDRGAFEGVLDEVLATVMSIFRRANQCGLAIAVQPTPLDDKMRDAGRTSRKRAALLAQVGRYEFDPNGFEVVEGEPIVYWWGKEFLERYAGAPKLGEVSPAQTAWSTGDNVRLVRHVWEVRTGDFAAPSNVDPEGNTQPIWSPFMNGSDGAQWIEPLRNVARWAPFGVHFKLLKAHRWQRDVFAVSTESYFHRPGVAFSQIGSVFSARLHRYGSVLGDKGSSVFPNQLAQTVCLMNRLVSRQVLASLNPSVSFQAGDVNRLPIFPVANSDEIFVTIDRAFTEHESHRESSVEFRSPGPSPWRYAQEWAQRAVDRTEGAPLPPYEAVYDPAEPESLVSFALGVALGRFGANAEGILDQAPTNALPAGILFVSVESRHSLDLPACSNLRKAWDDHGKTVGGNDDLRSYLRGAFFAYHKKLYENRPIYFPLSSSKKSFVAFVSIHRWQDDTLNVLLADHLVPEKRRLEGELEDLRNSRAQTTNKGKAEKRFGEVQKLLEELSDFIDKVTAISENGPPPSDAKCSKREVDARFVMDLDDGVMVNSSALWPLLESQWKDPKKWWKELATAQGRKDYDWAHLSARYFPERVRGKCKEDPSLAVAHKCFWELHPAKAYAWELRLQDEIRADFTIDEVGSDQARDRFLKEHAGDAREIWANEVKRRERKAAKAELNDEPIFEQGEQEVGEE